MQSPMTPEDFFLSFVCENYEDLENDPGDVRKAFNAALAASHMADQYYTYYEKHDPGKIKNYRALRDFIEHIGRKTNGYFKDIRSVANAYKHLYLRFGNPSISSIGVIESIEIEFVDKRNSEHGGRGERESRCCGLHKKEREKIRVYDCSESGYEVLGKRI